jgi:hypothetical protein
MPVRPLPSRRRVFTGFPVTFALYESVFAQGRTRYTPLQRWTLGDTDGILMKFSSPAARHADPTLQTLPRDVVTPEGKRSPCTAPIPRHDRCATPGDTVWYSTSENTKRKYPHTWEMTETQKGHLFALIPCAPIS